MKNYSMLFIIAFLLTNLACVKQTVHGVQTSNAIENEGLFKGNSMFSKIDSCTPTLAWEKANELDMTYDVAVYDVLKSPSGYIPPERRQQIYYQENVQGTSVQINPPLLPNTSYFWSVRTRKPTGEVSAWTVYDKSMNYILNSERRYNFWFGIRTPKECAHD